VYDIEIVLHVCYIIMSIGDNFDVFAIIIVLTLVMHAFIGNKYNPLTAVLRTLGKMKITCS
jgi:hypothetical protein